MSGMLITELDSIVELCKKSKHIYICDSGDKRKNLYRFVRDCVKIDVSKIIVLTLDNVSNIAKEENIGILIGFLDEQNREIISKLNESGFTDYLTLSEMAMRIIDYKLRVLQPEQFHFEVSLADHCNLSCQMCDHWSQLAKPHLLDVDNFERDIKRLSQLMDGKIGYICLLGGEPLLNNNILDFVKITRNYFPYGIHQIVTNGIRLLKFNKEQEKLFYNTIKENNFQLTVTLYPIKIDHNAIYEKAKEYGVEIYMASDIHANDQSHKESYKYSFDLSGTSPIHRSLLCFKFNYCRCLKNGRIYTCNTPSNIHIFNDYFGKSLSVSDEDYIDIFKVNSFQEIAEFCAKPSPFCRYCDIQAWGDMFPWKPSTKKIEEYV
ncbi:MAG: radical SAM protein [Fibromonadaceae bacterium]|jgi:hypothetical protein|nr:radical SAM protein [Fibromonadaceae bacterium]